jgi:hypothetical protein
VASNTFPAESLVHSLGSEHLADALAAIADSSVDAAIEGGALVGVPIIGTVLSLAKTDRDIRCELYVRKLALFLHGFGQASTKARLDFAWRIREEGEAGKVGSSVLLLLERADDLAKPELVGRLLAASAEGRLPLDKALRIAAMLDRAYMQDIVWLRDCFYSGTQEAEAAPIAESLFAAGFLSNLGWDGGNASGQGGGVFYEFNDFGAAFLEHVYGITLPRTTTAPGQVWLREQRANDKGERAGR